MLVNYACGALNGEAGLSYCLEVLTHYPDDLSFAALPRIRKGADRDAWQHPHFLRGRPFELAKITRTAVKRTGSRTKDGDAVTAPAFVGMPPIAIAANGPEDAVGDRNAVANSINMSESPNGANFSSPLEYAAVQEEQGPYRCEVIDGVNFVEGVLCQEPYTSPQQLFKRTSLPTMGSGNAPAIIHTVAAAAQAHHQNPTTANRRSTWHDAYDFPDYYNALATNYTIAAATAARAHHQKTSIEWSFPVNTNSYNSSLVSKASTLLDELDRIKNDYIAADRAKSYGYSSNAGTMTSTLPSFGLASTCRTKFTADPTMVMSKRFSYAPFQDENLSTNNGNVPPGESSGAPIDASFYRRGVRDYAGASCVFQDHSRTHQDEFAVVTYTSNVGETPSASPPFGSSNLKGMTYVSPALVASIMMPAEKIAPNSAVDTRFRYQDIQEPGGNRHDFQYDSLTVDGEGCEGQTDWAKKFQDMSEWAQDFMGECKIPDAFDEIAIEHGNQKEEVIESLDAKEDDLEFEDMSAWAQDFLDECKGTDTYNEIGFERRGL